MTTAEGSTRMSVGDQAAMGGYEMGDCRCDVRISGRRARSRLARRGTRGMVADLSSTRSVHSFPWAGTPW